jgi:multisubunit Na+/H+ antiporter MnhG subunit
MADDGAPGPGTRAGAAAGPTALPDVTARVVAFVVILVGGFSGLLIGVALVRVQCTGDCSVSQGVGALVGGVSAAVGVSVIAVLVLRAMGEWRAGARPDH